MITIRRRHNRRSVPGLNMASMPDLIFTILFFFMLVTHMRTETVQVKYDLPKGTEISKPTNKRTNMNIYIGKDKNGESRIQVNDKMVTIESVAPMVEQFKGSLNDEDMETMTVSLHADKNTPMGIVNDIKKELRKLGSITIRYSASDSRENVK